MSQTMESFYKIYKELYDHFPGFAYRTKVVEYERGRKYLCRQEVVSGGSFDIFGLSPEDMYGFNSIERNTLPEDIEHVHKTTLKALDSGKSTTLFYRVLHVATKQIKWVREEQRVIRDENGRPTHIEGFLIDVSREKLYEQQLEEENRRLRGKQDEHGDRLEGMLGRSEAMHALFECLRRAAPGDSSIILYGETGTGKDIAARTVHQLSGRTGAFVPVNCGAIPENLLESEFFGHVRGAFSGAITGHEGYLAAADGGTLFLDEIGELPLEAQGVLLRVLEEGRFMRVGGTEEIETDVRLITATNRNLPALVREGKFREDLFMRLNVVPLRIPPLRERPEDIGAIADNWWFNHFRKHLSDGQKSALEAYTYPGNVRELLNILERAIVFREDDFAKLIAEHQELSGDLSAGGAGSVSAKGKEAQDSADIPDDLDDAIRRHVHRVFEKYARNVSKAATALNITRTTLRKWL